MSFRITALALLLAGCSTTAPDQSFTGLPSSGAVLLSGDWHALRRIEPLYPVEEASAGKDGCATLEYVITPDYQIKDITVQHSTSRYFAAAARKSLNRWNWADLPKGIISSPVKAQTRFEYCIETTPGKCDENRLKTTSQCPGDDVLFAIGSLVRRAA